MTRKESLAELIAKVEAGKWWLDVGVAKAYCAKSGLGNYSVKITNAHNGSIDAAMSLRKAVLPGWFAGVSENIYGHGWHGWVQTHECSMDANSDDPARALLLAILRALHSMEPDQTP